MIELFFFSIVFFLLMLSTTVSRVANTGLGLSSLLYTRLFSTKRASERLNEEELLGERADLGQSSLSGAPLWSQYSRKIKTRMKNPVHRGFFTKRDENRTRTVLVVAEHGAEACGDAARLYLLIDPKTGVVKDARFETFGCATAIASCDVAAEMCIGQKLSDLQKRVSNRFVELRLRDVPDKPALPQQKMHCSVLASSLVVSALREAKKDPRIAKFVPVSKTSDVGDDDYVVCDCAGVTLGDVRRAIRENGLETVAQITQYTKAGAFCKSCVKPGGHEKKRIYLLDILQRELDRAKEQRSSVRFDE